MQAHEKYEAIIRRAEADQYVVGLVLGGGRGKGVFSERSDFDIFVITTDDAPAEAVASYASLYETEVIDIHAVTLDDFRKIGDWAAYGLARLSAVIDKTGEVQPILDNTGVIPAEKVRDYVEESLDAFINQYYRAFKNHRDGNRIAARLDATESVPLLLNVLFGQEGRVRPYNKFLEWELERYPLNSLPWTVGDFLELIRAVIDEGDIETLTKLYKQTRETALTLGFDRSIRGWEGYQLE